MATPVIYYINGKKKTASNELAHLLQKCIRRTDRSWDEIVFLCIGSDRITGDSLGPLIGYQLSKYRWKNIYIYGTLEEPVHALNLEDTLRMIKERHPTALTIAVDASLGSQKHIGYITVGMGSLFPGAGVQKELPTAGDIFITGILNLSGTFKHFLLQTTRLSLVMEMADTIVAGITENKIILRSLLPARTHPVHPVYILQEAVQPDRTRQIHPEHRSSEPGSELLHSERRKQRFPSLR